jgi:hypothetical protein
MPANKDSTGFDPAALKPFTAGEPYLGVYETGLYPGAQNEPPAAHRAAGERLAATIRPLDAEGQPDELRGRVLGLVLGHSNARMYFGALRRFLGTPHPELEQASPRAGYLANFDALWQEASERLTGRGVRPTGLHPRFALLNAAVGGQQLPQLVALQGPVWDRAHALTHQPGYSPEQVQALFLHTTYHGARNRDGAPPGPFPDTMQQMQRGLATVLGHCVRTYPNLKIAYLTADGFRHHTGYEPHVWQEAFAVKWLIERQINGEPDTAYAGDARRLPWLQWGPYIWDNTWDASYFTDGVHPAAEALAIFVEQYWRHLSRDRVARPWLLAA